MILVDTSFLIDLIDGYTGAVEMAKKPENEPVCLSVISVHEYMFGVYYKFSENRILLQSKIAMAENVFDAYKIIPFTRTMALSSARIHSTLVRQGRHIDINDVYIAATSMHYGTKLLTRNTRRFEPIKGLLLETY